RLVVPGHVPFVGRGPITSYGTEIRQLSAGIISEEMTRKTRSNTRVVFIVLSGESDSANVSGSKQDRTIRIQPKKAFRIENNRI
ncbi:hypothetical protein Bbelb_221310, partial [Branchiostoma belcheri]